MILPRDAVGAVTRHGWKSVDSLGQYRIKSCTIISNRGHHLYFWKAEIPVIPSFDPIVKDEGACALNVSPRNGSCDARFLSYKADRVS